MCAYTVGMDGSLAKALVSACYYHLPYDLHVSQPVEGSAKELRKNGNGNEVGG